MEPPYEVLVALICSLFDCVQGLQHSLHEPSMKIVQKLSGGLLERLDGTWFEPSTRSMRLLLGLTRKRDTISCRSTHELLPSL